MRMRIDFYSKDKMAIQVDFSGRYPFPDNEHSELFLFTCFTLRQLHNLGEHVVAKALAGILVSENVFPDLLQGNIDLRSGDYLLTTLRFHVTRIVSASQGIEASINATHALDSRLNFNKSIMQILDNDFLDRMPKLVEFNGLGKKSFDVSLPPFSLKAKGFGLFGREVNYHAFHSVIALVRFLGQKHKNDQDFYEHFIQVAQHCGTAYIFNQIPNDQVGLANTILKKVEIS